MNSWGKKMGNRKRQEGIRNSFLGVAGRKLPQSCGREGGRVEQLGTAVQKIKQLPCQCQNNGKEAREGRVGEKARAISCATQ